MGEMDRRTLLKGVAAAALTPTLPTTILAAPTPPAPPHVAWVVGTPGEFDWQHVFARTAEHAWEIWCRDNDHFRDDVGDELEEVWPFDPEYVQRVPAFDDKGSALPGDWINAGLGHICSRCGYETCPDMGGRAVGDEAVCEECLTFADEWAIDPEEACRELADRIANDGEPDTERWLRRQGVWESVQAEAWPLALLHAKEQGEARDG